MTSFLGDFLVSFFNRHFESAFFSYETVRPPAILEVTEEEEDNQDEGDNEPLPPPPPPISENLEAFLTPVKNPDHSFNTSRNGILSDRKVRNVTQV